MILSCKGVRLRLLLFLSDALWASHLVFLISAQVSFCLRAWEVGLSHFDFISDSTGQQESKGNMCEEVSMGETLMERLSGDVPVSPSIDTAQEEQQPQKALDAEDEDSSPASPQRQSVIQQSAQDKATPYKGTGTKRPHPDDEDEEDPECPSSTSSYKPPFDAGKGLHVGGCDSGQDPGTSAVPCPAVDEFHASQGNPYTCSECGEAFAWISNLIEHHKSHSTETCHVSQDC